MKPTLYMIQRLFIIILLFPFFDARAQTESTNVFKYTPQPGFKKSKLDGRTEFYFKKDKKWVIIDLYDIRPSFGNPAEDAQNDWNEIVVPNFAIKGDVVTENHERDGWQITARTTISSVIKNNVSLITFTCPGGHASILLKNNDFGNVLDAETGAFIESLTVVSPAEALTYIKPVANNMVPPCGNYAMPGMNTPQPDPNYQVPGMNQPQPAPVHAGGNYMPPAQENYPPQIATNPYGQSFPTPGEQPVRASIMMDVGWFVEATNDYIQYTKNDIKVIQYFYVAPEDPDSNTPDEDLFWRKYLNRYFSAATYNRYPNDSYDLLNRIEFASCNAVYQPNGQQYFIAWLVDNHNSLCSYLAITSSEQVYNSYFAHPNDLGAMNQFNNFPVTALEIQGEWSSANFGGAQMYSSITGNYAGMSVASSGTSFVFSGDQVHKSSQGASGMVGAMQTYAEERNGNFSVNGYSLITSSTGPQPETHEYSCAFKYGKNAKILFLQDKKYSAMNYCLVKK